MKQKRFALLAGALIGLVVLAGIWVWFFPSYSFVLSGDADITISYGTVYEDEGIRAELFGFPAERYVQLKENTVNPDVIGDYAVTYTFNFGHVKEEVTRMVHVRDLKAPRLSASYRRVLYVEQGKSIPYPTFHAVDEIDGDVSDTIAVETIDENAVGMHFVRISAEDASGNVGTIIQPVMIWQDEETIADRSSALHSGLYVSYMDDLRQYHIEGYRVLEDASIPARHQLLLIGDQYGRSYQWDLKQMDQNDFGYFEGTFDLSSLPNDSYRMYVVTTMEEDGNRLERIDLPEYTINPAARLGRWHIGDKLITFLRDTEETSAFRVEDFAYQYDIAIDVGHGGDDIGAAGLGTYERDLNLMVSLYEKERYEAHGLKVWLIRDGKEYAELLGDEDWHILQRVGYTLGWYGAVSKVVYSNHHNSDGKGTHSGFEIIVLPDRLHEQQTTEYQIYRSFCQLYERMTNTYQYYSRSYNTGKRLDRSDGKIYPNERVYYANMRYPWEGFGVDVVTFEAAYINNAFDYQWYVQEENWKKVSEVKIKAYVEALGYTYIEP